MQPDDAKLHSVIPSRKRIKAWYRDKIRTRSASTDNHADPKVISPTKRKRTASGSEDASMNDMEERQHRAEVDAQAAFDSQSQALVNKPDKQYDVAKANLLGAETDGAWDAAARNSASEMERQAARTIHKIREHDRDVHFGNKASEAIPGDDTLDMGGQFLTNKDRIESSDLFRIARRMPKGAEHHLHLNAEFPPDQLLEWCRGMKTMFIRSTQPILSWKDCQATEVVFQVLPNNTPTVDIFSPKYNPDFRSPGATPWMTWIEFRKVFEHRYQPADAEKWVRGKMILSEEEVYGIRQTVNGVWARFNQGTRCFKGLLNYEGVFRWYIGALIDNLIAEGVMYAELRPMWLDKSIPSDDGRRKLGHEDQLRIIDQEIKKKAKELDNLYGNIDKWPFGLKIIYCAPRSIPKSMMQNELKNCIRLKLGDFGHLICGFDLVGAEDRPNHIGFYKDELTAFVNSCKALNIEIPFMFHAGETLLDTGGSKLPENSNLYDAVIFNAKRIGHGYSLLKHPQLVEEFRKRRICIELCPTSNELLHLCRNIKEHPYPQILAMGIPCTVNSDNPSLFSSSLSHEFYQVMVGSVGMNLHGWKQLAEWSLTYSCLNEEQRQQAYKIFKVEWEKFCEWVVSEFGAKADGFQLDGI